MEYLISLKPNPDQKGIAIEPNRLTCILSYLYLLIEYAIDYDFD
jgi:hypothetical protein